MLCCRALCIWKTLEISLGNVIEVHHQMKLGLLTCRLPPAEGHDRAQSDKLPNEKKIINNCKNIYYTDTFSICVIAATAVCVVSSHHRLIFDLFYLQSLVHMIALERATMVALPVYSMLLKYIVQQPHTWTVCYGGWQNDFFCFMA